ncbi:SAM-dependent methyltransferase [Actinorhabdospora filicis]|uniref:SAM-dependent methyltransferase n=1 Tax=Actinorhabdospora filicis TaxID=1785913 RepID=A0A9W6W7R8_9ACTN|nr:class I SAM-dependent methyltransferase [Actinorhabdospora filicis]GLZ76208.1 SAM-dependent methyltransferase [Actinorhabdospora filicis]
MQIDIDRLRDHLDSTGYTPEGVSARVGTAAVAASARGDHRATLAATEGLDPLDALIRLFTVGVAVPVASIDAAVRPLVDAEGRAAVSLEFYEDFRVLSDLPAAPGRDLDGEHVLGVGGASATLAASTLREPVGSALDVGTGCGVQALRLAGHAARVTATDLSPRALEYAAMNARLNGQDWELLEGDMLAPVAGRRFDLVVSNPPFVVGAGESAFTYRDSGRAGDGVCAELAAAAPKLLNPGGTMQFLANWLHVRGQDWRERVSGWFAGTGCDLWVVQREVTDPLDYVRVWQRDASVHDPAALAAWLDWFEANEVEAVGFGMVTARLSGREEPVVECEDVRHAVDGPWSARVAERLGRFDYLAGLDAAGLLDAHLRLAPGVELRQEAELGEEGWEVGRQLLAQTTGMRYAEEIDPLLVSFLGGCTGHAPVRTIVRLLASAHEAPEPLLAASLSPVIRHFIQRGFLLPSGA